MRATRFVQYLAIASVFTVASSCSAPAETTWYDQLTPDSPCYRVNLLDGLLESETTEVNDLFACLNYHGHLKALEPVAETIEVPTRQDDAVGQELAVLVNTLPDVDVDVFALAGLALDALDQAEPLTTVVADLYLELTYATRADVVRGSGFELNQPSRLRAGVLSSLAPITPIAAQVLLDDPYDSAGWAGSLLQDAETHRWIYSLDGMVLSPDPTVDGAITPFIQNVGVLLPQTRSPDNDLWLAASGDSLRDVVDTLLVSEAGVVEEVSPIAATLLADVSIRTQLETELMNLHGDGTLYALFPELKWMAGVDAFGDPLSPGGDSAITAFIRLLADTNQPMVCSLNLWVTNLDINLGNLAVTIIDILADLDPSLVQTGSGILGDILGFPRTDLIVDEIAASGVCPTLTPQVADDLHAVDAISRDEARHVLKTVITVFRIMKYGQQNRLQDLADLMETIERAGGIKPLEELIRDAGDETVVINAVDLVPILHDPAGRGVVLRSGESSVDLQDLLGIVQWLFQEDATSGLTGWERLRPLVQPLVVEDGSWDAVHRLAPLLSDQQSQTAQMLELIPRLLEIDPELSVLHQVGPLLGDKRLSGPLLRTLEVPSVSETALATNVSPDQQAPLAFGAQLIVDGTLDDVLQLVDLILDALSGEGLLPD